MIWTYIIAVVVILGLCAFGLSIGVLLRGKGLRACGNALRGPDGEIITCPACGTKGKECKDEKKLESTEKAS